MFYRLATLMSRMRLNQVKQMDAKHVYCEEVRKVMDVNAWRTRSMDTELYFEHLETFRVTKSIGHRVGILTRSYEVGLRNKRCNCGRFQTLRYSWEHIVALRVHVNVYCEQYIDELYTLERTLRIWGNEFHTLLDVLTWEVPLPIFELLPDLGLRRVPKNHPHVTKI